MTPTTKCNIHESIEILLDIICGKERKTIPVWRNEIEILEINEFERKIREKQKEIEIIQREISEIKLNIDDLDSHRDLFTATGDELEKIVQKTLSEIGIETEKTERGFPADLINKEFAVEITGIKGSVGVGSEKVNQVGRFKESYSKGEKIILIANTNMDLSPKEREGKTDFSKEVNEYFKSLSVYCLSTKMLFELWKDVINEKKQSKDVKNKLLVKIGELTSNDLI